MYVDHNTVRAVQAHRAAELHRLATLRRRDEDVRVAPSPEPSRSWSPVAAFVALVRPRRA